MGVDEQGAGHIVKGAKDTFSFPILRRSIRAGEAEVCLEPSRRCGFC
jgi:hypothetical protein